MRQTRPQRCIDGIGRALCHSRHGGIRHLECIGRNGTILQRAIGRDVHRAGRRQRFSVGRRQLHHGARQQAAIWFGHQGPEWTERITQ